MGHPRLRSFYMKSPILERNDPSEKRAFLPTVWTVYGRPQPASPIWGQSRSTSGAPIKFSFMCKFSVSFFGRFVITVPAICMTRTASVSKERYEYDTVGKFETRRKVQERKNPTVPYSYRTLGTVRVQGLWREERLL